MKQIILIVFQVVLGALLLTEQKLDKIYVGVLSGSESRKWVYMETI